MRVSSICGVPVTIGATLDSVLKKIDASAKQHKSLCVTFVNPHAASLCSSGEYRNHLWRFDLVLCDGIGMAYAASMISGRATDRISFDATSLAPFVFQLCQAEKMPVYLIGGVEGVADHAGTVISKIFPGIRIAGVSPGFGEKLVDIKKLIILEDFCAVVVGMGVRRQEEFVLELMEAGCKGVVFTCGGYFDQIGSDGNYYPGWVNKLNVRFLYRIYKEPRRLARRYFIGYMPFLRNFGLSWLRKLFSTL